MSVLAIDQSLVNSGITIKDNEGSYLNLCIAPKKLRGVVRLQYIRNELRELIEKYDIKTVVMEGYSYGSRGATFDMGELGGVIKVMTLDMDLRLFIVAPTALKKFVTGKGNCKKDLMLLKIYKRWGIEFTNDNIADSYALMKYCEVNYEGNKV